MTMRQRVDRVEAPAQTWQPTWSRRNRTIHLSYDLPHKVYDSQIYPVPALNGATIIICGHHLGITIIWRGGGAYKSPRTRNDHSRDNTPRNKEEQSTLQDGLAATQTSANEFDPTEPYDKIISSKLLELDSDALRISLPPVPSDLDAQTSQTMPTVLKEEMVFAAACADGSVRMFRLPLHPSDSYRSRQDESVIVQPHRSPFAVSRGMSITWTGRQNVSSGRNDESSPSWSFLIANSTAIAGGLLMVYQAEIPMKRSGSFHWTIVQEEYLRQVPSLIRFNSSCFPSPRHTQLLLSMSGGLKLYDPLPRTRFHQHQRDPQAGSWLVSLNVPFNPANMTQFELGQRLKVLDAQWTCDGKCLIVLLEDGQWGLWNLAAMAFQPLQRGKRNNIISSGLSGGGVTRFALSGYLGENAAAMVAKLNLNGGHNHSRDTSALTPMTPNTRKTKQQALFSGPISASLHSSISQGGISVRRLEVPTIGSIPDDAIVMWYKNILYAIPSLSSFWREGGAVGGGPTPRSVDGFNSFNENVINVSQMVGEGSRTSSPLDMVLSTEHRILMLQPEQTARTLRQSSSQTDSARQQHREPIEVSRVTAENDMDLDEKDVVARDQDLLMKNQLDLGGLDRMLSTMNGGGDTSSALFGGRSGMNLSGGLFSHPTDSKTRRVGFAAGI